MHSFNILNYSFYNIVLYFIAYSFLGWCVEVAYAYKNQRKFVNRGFLHGPLCPIYGTCILSLVVLLNSFKANIFVLFILATISTSTIEYFTGFILEKLFKTKYWDYTEDPFNLHGRICLHFSLMWGLLSLVVVKIIHPLVFLSINMLPPRFGLGLFYILLIFLILDFSTTIASLISVKKIHFNFQLDNVLSIGRYNNFIRSSKEKNISKSIDILKEMILNFRNKT